jgi:DNA-binding HxlR family transcriptional regulator
LLHGKRTYGELALSPERIPTNILADRLERLVSAGIVTRTPYQQRPVRYTYALTAKGRALGDVLLAFVRWGKQHIPGTVALNQ